MEFECIDSIGRDIFREKEDDSDNESWNEDPRERTPYKKDGPNESDAVRMYQILLFGSTAKGESVCVQVEGYRPSFLIRLPTKLPISSAIRSLTSWILEVIHFSAASSVTFTHERHKTLWDYNGEALSDFLRVDVPSMGLWRRCKDRFSF